MAANRIELVSQEARPGLVLAARYRDTASGEQYDAEFLESEMFVTRVAAGSDVG